MILVEYWFGLHRWSFLKEIMSESPFDAVAFSFERKVSENLVG